MSDEGKLFVGGLSPDTDEQTLDEQFSKYGQITEVRVIKDRETMASRGFGFVTFNNPEDAKDALQAMNGKSIDGRQIRVGLAGKKSGGDRGYSRGGGSGDSGNRRRGGGGYWESERSSCGGGGRYDQGERDGNSVGYQSSYSGYGDFLSDLVISRSSRMSDLPTRLSDFDQRDLERGFLRSTRPPRMTDLPDPSGFDQRGLERGLRTTRPLGMTDVPTRLSDPNEFDQRGTECGLLRSMRLPGMTNLLDPSGFDQRGLERGLLRSPRPSGMTDLPTRLSDTNEFNQRGSEQGLLRSMRPPGMTDFPTRRLDTNEFNQRSSEHGLLRSMRPPGMTDLLDPSGFDQRGLLRSTRPPGMTDIPTRLSDPNGFDQRGSEQGLFRSMRPPGMTDLPTQLSDPNGFDQRGSEQGLLRSMRPPGMTDLPTRHSDPNGFDQRGSEQGLLRSSRPLAYWHSEAPDFMTECKRRSPRAADLTTRPLDSIEQRSQFHGWPYSVNRRNPSPDAGTAAYSNRREMLPTGLWKTHQGHQSVGEADFLARSQALAEEGARHHGTPDATSQLLDPSVRTHLPFGMADSKFQRPGPTSSSHLPRKRGRRAGLQVKMKQRGFKSPIPSMLLANVQGIENKLDEIKARITNQRELRDCCVLCFTETWLTPASPDHAIQPEGFSIHRTDRTVSSDSVSGGGVCFLINTSWCSDVAVLASSCSPDLEYLIVKCRPYYLPREFTLAILTAVYIPLQANVKLALEELCTATNSLETKYPEALFIMAGSFNQANFNSTLPKYYQHVSCPTKGPNILDHCYTTIKDAYHSIPRPHFLNSDHQAMLLLPAYKQKLKCGDPVQKVVQCWSEEKDELLRDCFESVDWSIFKDSADDLNEYATAVTDFISKCVEDCVPKKSIRVFPNEKPWMNWEIRSLLKSRTEAFKSGDPDLYRKSRYDLRKAIRDAKRQYQTTLESQPDHTDTCRLWQGLHAPTDRIAGSNTSLPNELGVLYALFEQKASEITSPASEAPAPTVTVEDVRSAFLKVNPWEATGLDGVPGRVLRTCADQLAGVFADIFNLSLLQSEDPTCFDKTTVPAAEEKQGNVS